MTTWKNELRDIIATSEKSSRAEREQALFDQFLKRVVSPAFTELAAELKALSCYAKIRMAAASASLTLYKDAENAIKEITFSINKFYANDGILPCARIQISRNSRILQYDESFKNQEGVMQTLNEVTQEDIIGLFLHYYRLVKEG